jgi:putative heme-binding domain-containing protein
VKEMPEIVKPNIRVSAFGEDNDGEIYYAEYDTGVIYTLERNDAAGANTNFPKTLGETGLFKDVKALEPAEGVVPFRPNARQWQDGATADYLLALPGTSSVSLFDQPRPLPGQVFWHNFRMQFPADAVLVKTIRMDTVGGPKRIETQILHCDGEDWRGYTYAWRDDQTDADLVPADGAEKAFTVADDRVGGGKREQVWTFHSRNQCMSCHSSWAEYALAFAPGQLNGSGHGTRGEGPNQLVRFSQEGYIRRVGKDDQTLPPLDEAAAAKEVALVDPHDSAQPLDKRARSYLHANCAHCHRFGGGGGQVVLEMDIARPLKEVGIHDVPPKQGDFGIPDARLVKPGDPTRSVLLYRMAKFGRGRMPHLGSEVPDPSGLKIMTAWISSLGKGEIPPPAGRDALPAALRSPETAIQFAWRMTRADLDKAECDTILAAAAKLEPGPVRDLFEGYLPPDPKGRKLGNTPRPAAILSLTGDAKKGEAVFFTKENKCANCHKVGDKGVSVGPELTAIGKTRTRAELLESLLQPSVRVEPQHAAYLVRTKDEKTVTGLLVNRDDRQVIVRDAENKEHAFPAADVEAVTPSRLSLMPDGALAGLTPQEAADLLEFLATRR